MNFMQIFFQIWPNALIVYPCRKFCCDRATNNEDNEASTPPKTYRCQEKPSPIKPGFHVIAGDRSRLLGSPVTCSAIVTTIWKPNFHFASDRQRSQRLPTIATIAIAGIESESISAIVAIVNDRQRSQKVNGNHQCSDCSDRNDRNDPSDHMETIAQRSQRSWWSQRSYVFCDLNDPSDYMETKLQQLWRLQRSNVFSDRNDRQRSYGK